MKRYWIFLVIITLILSACGPATPTTQPTSIPTARPEPHALTVFAAASLTDAFTEIGKNFDAAHPSVTSTFNYAGSQALRTQLEQGAIADIFASANTKEMDTLVTDNLVPTDTTKIFVTNSLLVIMPANNPANIQTLQDLSRSGLKLILADATVPAGKYVRQILDIMSKDPTFGSDFGTKVLTNVVSNETDVKQVVAKVQLGEADAGIVYVSDSVAVPELKTIDIPANFNVIAKYPIAVLANAPQSQLASEFIAYVLSAAGQAILQKWGFTSLQP